MLDGREESDLFSAIVSVPVLVNFARMPPCHDD